jgi:molybdate transport system substrate-binding protein
MTVAAREIVVLSTTALQTTLEALAPTFERTTGYRLTFHFGPSGRMANRVGDGEANDLAIVTGAGIDDLVVKRRTMPGTRADIARSKIGAAVQKGAPRPDISSVDAFKRTLSAAKTIGMSNPVGGGQSGAHLAKVFETLGIAEAMKIKATYGPGGPEGLIGKYLLRKEVEFGLQQMPELMAVEGIDILGPIPAELQLDTVFSAGISTAAKNADGAKQWIDYLRMPTAAAVIEAKGMQPG